MRFVNRLQRISVTSVLITLLPAIGSTVFAADPTTQPQDPIAAQYFAVAAARTHAELALRNVQRFFEENKSTIAVIGDDLDSARSKSLSLIERAQSNEQHKPEADRSDEVSEDLARRSHAITERWQRLYAVERPAIAARYEAATSSLVTIASALAVVNTLEQQWKDLELNLASVEAAYLEVARRAERARDQGEAAINDLKRQRDDWESTLHSTLAIIGPRAGSRPNGVPSGL